MDWSELCNALEKKNIVVEMSDEICVNFRVNENVDAALQARLSEKKEKHLGHKVSRKN